MELSCLISDLTSTTIVIFRLRKVIEVCDYYAAVASIATD